MYKRMKNDSNFAQFAEGFLQECINQGIDEDTSVSMLVKCASVMEQVEMEKSAKIKSFGSGAQFVGDLFSDLGRGVKKVWGAEQAAQQGVGKGLKGFAKWHTPGKTALPGGGSAYTGKDLALSASKLGLTGGAGYLGYKHLGKPAFESMFPGWASRGGYEGGGVPADAYLDGSFGGSGGAGGGAHNPNLPGYQSGGSSPYGPEAQFMPGGAATSSSAAGASTAGKTIYEQQSASRNKRLNDMQKQIQEKRSILNSLDTSGIDPSALEQKRALQEEIDLLQQTYARGEKDLQALGPRLSRQEAQRDKRLADRLQGASGYVEKANRRQQAMMDALRAESTGNWWDSWRIPWNRMRGINMDAAQAQYQEFLRAQAEQRALQNVSPNYYFPGQE
jgi:hypothetical protein